MNASPTVIASLAGVLIAGCATPDSAPDSAASERFEFAQAQMGLEFRITVFAKDEEPATRAVTAAFARIADLNAILSDYDSDSELSQLSRTSGTDRWVTVSDDLWTILATGQRLAVQSDGAFDLTIGPSVNLWRRARRRSELPSTSLLTAMHERVGYRHLSLNEINQSAKLLKPNMRLDAGGIAKGFAMDEALRVLQQNGIDRAMIHGGGDMVFGNPPPERDGWTVQLGESDSDVLVLANAALATSGDLVQYLEIDGVRYSHIIDPRTGIGLTNRSLVHVIAPAGITADSLSTTLNILGPDQAKQLIKGYRSIEFRMTTLTASGPRQTETAGFNAFLSQ